MYALAWSTGATPILGVVRAMDDCGGQGEEDNERLWWPSQLPCGKTVVDVVPRFWPVMGAQNRIHEKKGTVTKEVRNRLEARLGR